MFFGKDCATVCSVSNVFSRTEKVSQIFPIVSQNTLKPRFMTISVFG